MIMGTFDLYLVRTAHDHESPGARVVDYDGDSAGDAGDGGGEPGGVVDIDARRVGVVGPAGP
jgi:hypothetical protein